MTEKNDKNDKNDQTLDAALAHLQLKARAAKRYAPTPALSPLRTQTPDLGTLLTGKPLELALDKPDPADAQTTQALLDAYHRDDGWHCPKCQQTFTDPTAFAHHLIDELNRALARIASQTTGTHPPQTTTPPTV